MSKKSLIFHIIISLSLISLCAANGFATTLSWEEPDYGGVTGYRVYYGSDMNHMALIKQIDSNVKQLSLDFITLEIGTTYFFGIKAYNSVGESDYSNIVSYTPGDKTVLPLAPERVRVE